MAAGTAALAVSQRGADYAVSPFAVAAPFPVAVVCTWHVEHFALARVYNGRYSLRRVLEPCEASFKCQNFKTFEKCHRHSV